MIDRQGAAILPGGHFQVRECYLGGHFNEFHESSTKQLNKRELKLNVTALKSLKC